MPNTPSSKPEKPKNAGTPAGYKLSKAAIQERREEHERRVAEGNR